MRLGINLRSDLRKLSDKALAAELDRLAKYREARFGSAPSVDSIRGIWRYSLSWPFGRGPIHHRIAYRILIGYYWIFRGPMGTLYLVECEIKDLRDEIRYRANEKTSATVIMP